MTGLKKDFASYLSTHLQQYRNYQLLQATMAVCALVDTADGEAAYLEGGMIRLWRPWIS